MYDAAKISLPALPNRLPFHCHSLLQKKPVLWNIVAEFERSLQVYVDNGRALELCETV
jgi:hypothetical protein